MNDILSELFLGQLNPAETIIPKTKKYLSIQIEIAELIGKLETTLNKDERLLFERIIEKKNEDGAHYGSHCFISGYKHGVKMIFEVFADENNDAVGGM